MVFVAVASAAQPEDAEVAAVRKAGAAYVKALESGDRQALAAAWVPEGKFIDAAGRSTNARELIAKEFAEKSAAPRSVRAGGVEIRLVTPDVAIEDGTTEHVSASGGATPRSRFTAVWVKREGNWLLDSLRESALPPATNPRLASLNWLLGKFTGRLDDGTTIVVTAAPSPDGNFLLRDVVVSSPQRGAFTQTQRIGWDAQSNCLRSWTFDSTGGFAHGAWTREGEGWVVVTTGVSSAGKRQEARNTYSQIGAEGFTLESKASAAEGQPSLKVRLAREPAR
jgi:uncharacterized protein (TIGR02246 family)